MVGKEITINYSAKELLEQLHSKVDNGFEGIKTELKDVNTELKKGDQKFVRLTAWNKFYFLCFIVVFTTLGYVIF